MSRSAFPCGLLNVEASPTGAHAPSAARGVKRKGRSDNDIELQKHLSLKQMAANVDTDSADAFTTFGNQVALELRIIKHHVNLTRLKRNIMNMF